MKEKTKIKETVVITLNGEPITTTQEPSKE